MARTTKTTTKAPAQVAEENTKPDTSERARLLAMSQKKDETNG
jgi:hypothetical protein